MLNPALIASCGILHSDIMIPSGYFLLNQLRISSHNCMVAVWLRSSRLMRLCAMSTRNPSTPLSIQKAMIFFQFAADSLWSGSIDGLFPGMVGIGLGKSIIQCRLAVKEVFHIVSVACCVRCVYVLLGFCFFVGCPNVVITMLQVGISLLGL